jgi:hypothetical protein
MHPAYDKKSRQATQKKAGKKCNHEVSFDVILIR